MEHTKQSVGTAEVDLIFMREKPWPALQTKLNPGIVLYQGFGFVYNAGPKKNLSFNLHQLSYDAYLVQIWLKAFFLAAK